MDGFTTARCPNITVTARSDRFLRFHGINERISKKNYEELIQFYFNLIQNCDTRQLPEPHGAAHEL